MDFVLYQSSYLSSVVTYNDTQDWHGWKGHDDDIKQHGLPFCPGHEFSGIIVEKGALVGPHLNIGDRVAVPFILACGSCKECNIGKPTVCLHQEQPGFTCYGSFAEFVKVDRAKRNLRHIPKGVSFVEAAALGCRFTTAYRAVIQQGLDLDIMSKIDHIGSSSSRVSWSERKKIVAIFGCGGLGLSCIMIAKAFQNEGKIASIIAIDISSKALGKAKQLGADYTINVNQLEKKNTSVQEKVLQVTNGIGADLSIDAAGFQSTCEDALYCTRRGCRMVQVGLPIGSRRPNIDMGFVAAREIQIVGSHGFDANDLPILLNYVQNRRLDVKKLIEKEVSLEEGVSALMDMDQTSPLGMTMITNFSKSKL